MSDDRPSFRFPTGKQRVSVMGHTGSGKTHLSTWLLSHADWHRKPHVIVDFKYDDFFREIERSTYKGIEELQLTDKIPRKPGLYIVHPLPHETDELDEFLWKIWEKERTGVFVDEAHMMSHSPKHGAFRALLTQGRSKNIPMITVTQRPAWVSKFVFSEADYYSVFHLTDDTDKKRVMEFVPADLRKDLPEYHSYWHDVAKRKTNILTPVPDRATILARFQARLGEARQSKWNAFTSHGQSRTGSRWF
jgi:hypothetical protein